MVLLKNLINIFSVPELRKKLLFTLGILVVYRFGVHIPVIGVDVDALQQLLERAKGLGGVFSVILICSQAVHYENVPFLRLVLCLHYVINHDANARTNNSVLRAIVERR